jgi:hypothetical protein
VNGRGRGVPKDPLDAAVQRPAGGMVLDYVHQVDDADDASRRQIVGEEKPSMLRDVSARYP